MNSEITISYLILEGGMLKHEFLGLMGDIAGKVIDI